MLLLFVSPRFEFSADVLADGAGGDVVICGIGFFNCKFNGNGLFSVIKLRGNCIVLSSLISAGDVDDASTRFDNLEFFETSTDGIDDEEF